MKKGEHDSTDLGWALAGYFALTAGCEDSGDPDSGGDTAADTDGDGYAPPEDCDPATPDDDLDGDDYPAAADCDDADASLQDQAGSYEGDLLTFEGFCDGWCSRNVSGSALSTPPPPRTSRASAA